MRAQDHHGAAHCAAHAVRRRPPALVPSHVDLRGEPLPRALFVAMLMDASGMPEHRARDLVDEIADLIEREGGGHAVA